MAIAIIVEDGSIVVGANSYVTVADAIDYAASRGVVLSAGDPTAILLIKAMDYLEAQSYSGLRTDASQELDFPRTRSDYCGKPVTDDANAHIIPKQLKVAQMQLAMIASDGTELMPISDGRVMTKQVVGPIETDWAAANISNNPIFPIIDKLLAGLIGGNSLPFGGFGTVAVIRG